MHEKLITAQAQHTHTPGSAQTPSQEDAAVDQDLQNFGFLPEHDDFEAVCLECKVGDYCASCRARFRELFNDPYIRELMEEVSGREAVE